jgi:hypothetical protein
MRTDERQRPGSHHGITPVTTSSKTLFERRLSLVWVHDLP